MSVLLGVLGGVGWLVVWAYEGKRGRDFHSWFALLLSLVCGFGGLFR